MAVNHYFNHFNNSSEQNLIVDLTVEAIKMYGMDIFYLPRETIDRDEIFGEDIASKFDEKFILEMYLETVDGFEGQQDILANFGLQIIDTATLIVAKRRFQETLIGMERPMEGDLIYMPLSNAIFEINFVEHENPFYQIGKLHSYKLTIELFTHSHEEFDTGHENIDRVSTDSDPDVLQEMADNDEFQDESVDIIDASSRTSDPHIANQKDDFDETNPFGEF